jgi:metal-responsive CopG/Arc/MetJ family transcriptional regulator
MALKQISLTLPKNLLDASIEYTNEYGYRNIQELILEMLRKKVIMEKVERYKKIEDEMINKKNVKRFNQKDAINYLKNI